MLVRDFYIFYSKRNLFEDTVSFNFFCRAKDAQQIAFRLGCYAQSLLGFYPKKTFINPIHTVPDNFPNCIEVEYPENL